MAGALTEKKIKELVAVGAPTAVAHGDGLTLTISAKKTATWVLRYRIEGRRRELTLGRWPTLKIADAELKASEARLQIARDGVDPASEKKKARTRRPTIRTLRELALDYERVRLPELAKTTQAGYRGVIRRHIIPALGSHEAKDITPSMIVSAIDKRTKTVRTADVMKAVLASIFEHGMGLSVVPANPARGVSVAAIKGKSSPRLRVTLTEDELRIVLPALADLGEIDAIVCRILLATGVRKGELFNARWDHLDLTAGTWWVPDENSKSGTGFTIPIGGHSAVVGWFRRLRALAGGSPWVLPARRADKVKAGQNGYARGLNAQLDALCRTLAGQGVRRFTPHDFRSTMRGHFTRMKVAHAVSERALNHTLSRLVEVYDGHDYMDERKEALAAWVAYLIDLDPATRHPGLLKAA